MEVTVNMLMYGDNIVFIPPSATDIQLMVRTLNNIEKLGIWDKMSINLR